MRACIFAVTMARRSGAAGKGREEKRKKEENKKRIQGRPSTAKRSAAPQPR
jgi:hypothetical protein